MAHILSVLILLTILSTMTSGHSHPKLHSHSHSRRGGHICGQDEVWKYRLARSPRNFSTGAGCGLTPCDDPAVRDATSTELKKLNVRFHVITSDSGDMPDGLTEESILATIDEFKKVFQQYNIDFVVNGPHYHKDSTYYCLPAYSPNNRWFTATVALKEAYAVNPDKEMNVFIACMNTGIYGRLLGYGTFPWDSEALTNQGGVFMNSYAFFVGDPTLPHEFGHNVGLWHTFHGQEEVACPGVCSEPVHEVGDKAADVVGDFCSDTLSTPLYYAVPADPAKNNCPYPPADSTSCENQKWITAPEIYENLMSYTDCGDLFTEQQKKRAHCYLCQELKSIVSGCPN